MSGHYDPTLIQRQQFEKDGMTWGAMKACEHGPHYVCSRCGTCYVCTHVSLYRGGKWFWTCADGAVKEAMPER